MAVRLPRQPPQPSFHADFSPPATATPATASGPPTNRALGASRANGWGLRLKAEIKQATQRQQRIKSTPEPAKSQPAKIHRAQSRIQQLEYRLTENIRSRLSEQRGCWQRSRIWRRSAVSHAGARLRQFRRQRTARCRKDQTGQAGDIADHRLEDGWLESEVKSSRRARNQHSPTLCSAMLGSTSPQPTYAPHWIRWQP